MSDADREWTIEHAGEQLYDIISSLDYDETNLRYPWRQASEFERLSRQRAGV